MINILVPTLKDEGILENPLQMNIVWFVIKSGRAAVVELQCKLWRICIAKSLHENHPWIIYRDKPLLSTIDCEEEWALHLLLSVSKHEHGHYLWHTIPSLLLLSCRAYPTQAFTPGLQWMLELLPLWSYAMRKHVVWSIRSATLHLNWCDSTRWFILTKE